MRWRRHRGTPTSWVDQMWQDRPWLMRMARIRREREVLWYRLTGRSRYDD